MQAPPPASFLEAARQAIAQGKIDEAERLVSTRPESDPDAAAVRAQLLIRRGEYDAADALLRGPAGAEPSSAAALELGLLELLRGQRDPGLQRLRELAEALAGSGDQEELFRAARAARALGLYREANRFFRAAGAKAPDDPAINTEWGDLFLEKYNREDALKSYQAALRTDSTWAPAHLGVARIAAESNSAAARQAAERALSIDEAHVPTHLFLAELALDDTDRDLAADAIDRALALNPNSLPAHALAAAKAYVEDRLDDYEAAVARALALNPRYGEVYRVAGDHAARNYRFAEAAALTRQAIEIDPDNTRAFADLGLHLLRTGDEAEARQALERAFSADPYDVVTYNLLGLLDSLDKFETIEDGTVTLRMHPEEAPILREYALPLAHEALQSLSERYGFEPEGPILIEIFPKHDDFAVRNLGLPGMIGALGACFGRVVTMDSPRARPPGEFNWGATLWHELAHVITLQMSNQRVPRWLTEGISVFEESRARPAWGREMEVAFAQAMNAEKVLELVDLNAGFTNPETISLAYYEASLLVRHLVDRFGEPAVHDLLRAYGRGLDTDEALRQVMGQDLAGLQAGFDEALESQFGELRRALQEPDGGVPADAPVETLKALAEAHPGSYPALVAYGAARLRSGDYTGAMETLAAAVRLVPRATGPGTAHALLIEAAEQAGDRERTMAELEALLEYDHTNIDAARKLADLAEAAGDDRRRWIAYERIVALDPFDASRHGALGRLALERGDVELAVREFRAALAGDPVDRASAHADLAESYARAGRLPQAKEQVLAALELAPSYERAQELLLTIVEKQP